MPKTLTKTQFQSLRPKGRKKWSYQGYLSYLAKNRPPADPAMEQASKLVSSQLSSVKAEYDAAAKAQMADAIAASNAAKGFASAFGRAVADIPNSTGAAYQAAANAVAGFSGGLEGRAGAIAEQAGSDAARDVAAMSGMDMPVPDSSGALASVGELADIDAATAVGRAPYVTSTLNALDTAGRMQLADWADIQRHKGVKEAADIRAKYLIELRKRPELIQQAYLSLRKDKREARAMDITAAKMRLDQARLKLDRADSEAERKIAEREIAVAEKELDAKISGTGYYHKYPPSSSKNNKKDHAKLVEKRDAIIGDITSDAGLKYARNIVSPDGIRFTFGTKKLPRQRLIRLLAAHYWPMLRGYAGPKSQKQLNTKMMNNIIKIVDALSENFPQLKKGYKPTPVKPETEPEDAGGNGGSSYDPPGG
jgi:hypothetical protein